MHSKISNNNHPKQHYENFPVASVLCPKHIRAAVVAIYRFARTADDIADEGNATAHQRLCSLQSYRTALDNACKKETITCNLAWNDVMQPLQQAITQHNLPTKHLHDLITAFEQDIKNTQAGHVYDTWQDLHDYASYSANPVGRLMLHLYNIHDDNSLIGSDAICTALQFYNFWQDISVDVARKRYYLPRTLCAPLGVDPCQPQAASVQQREKLLTQLLDYTDALMQRGKNLPKYIAKKAPVSAMLSSIELQLVMQGGWRIGQKIRTLGSKVYIQRPVLHTLDWIHIIIAPLRCRFLD